MMERRVLSAVLSCFNGEAKCGVTRHAAENRCEKIFLFLTTHQSTGLSFSVQKYSQESSRHDSTDNLCKMDSAISTQNIGYLREPDSQFAFNLGAMSKVAPCFAIISGDRLRRLYSNALLPRYTSLSP